MPLINYEINLILTWSTNCVLTSKTTRDENPDAHPVVAAINNPTGAAFKITDTILYVPVVTLSTENGKTLIEQSRTGFKRIIKWNKYRSEMTNQAKNNNLNHLIDPTFTKVNSLFVLSFENEEDRISFSKYYVPNGQIKDFNVLIDGKSFFDMPIKNEEETYKQMIEMERSNDYTTGNLLYYEYFSKHYKLIAIDLRKQIKLENADFKQQINFIGRLERNEGATMFFIIKMSEETVFLLHIIMETQKVADLLGDEGNESSKLAIKKWYFIHDQNKTNYGEENKNATSIKLETQVIKSNLCDY